MAWCGQSLAAPVPLPGADFVGPHPKIATVERRELSRSPRDGGSRVAGATEVKSEAVGAPSTPHRGDGIAAVATPVGAKALVGSPADAKSEGTCEEAEQTRAQQHAAGTKKTALFDIVNAGTANGSLREPRPRAPCSQRGVVSASRRDASSLRSSAQIASISGVTSYPDCQLAAIVRSLSSRSPSLIGLAGLPRAARVGRRGALPVPVATAAPAAVGA